MTAPRPVRPSPRVPSRPGRGAAAGVTLIELMVVLALMATLLGFGISMYTNMGKQGVFSATIGRVLSTVNRVRNSSATHPAALQVNAGNPDKGEEISIRGVEFVPMCASQCEPPAAGETELQGAMDRNGILPPGAVFQDGVIGKALVLAGGGAVDFGNRAAYDATEGVSVDCWVRPDGNSGGTIVRRGDGLGLYLTRQAEGPGIRFELNFATGPQAAAQRGSEERQESAVISPGKFEPRGVVLPMDRWCRIVASYDRSAVTISLDTGHGPVEKLRQRETAPLAPTRKASMYVGGGGEQGGSFRGALDDIRVDGILGEDYEPFPAQVTVDGPTRKIRFLGGKLDPAYHTRPETITIRYGKRVRELVIGLEGDVVAK